MGLWLLFGIGLTTFMMLLFKKSFGVGFSSLSRLASSLRFWDNWFGSLINGHFMLTVAVACR